jgi:sugar lactone lactonase YvrE
MFFINLFSFLIVVLPNISLDAVWKSNAHTVVGDLGPGSTTDRLHSPQGISISKNEILSIADSLNHRIIKYDLKTRVIQRVAGKNIQGYGPDMLANPSNVIFHPKSKSYIICDYHNRRVLQWFPRSKRCAKILIENIACFGLAIDINGALYISDTERHEVRRYRMGAKYGKVVAGGHGEGCRLKQLNHPTYICVGDDQSVYVSDSWNNRVMKWKKGAKEGVIVAGVVAGKSKSLTQLDCPAGIIVDQLGTLYIADYWNHRVMRYRKDEEPDIIAGDRFLSGSSKNQLICPEGLAFDHDGNLYVADSNNHRIQKFKIRKS